MYKMSTPKTIKEAFNDVSLDAWRTIFNDPLIEEELNTIQTLIGNKVFYPRIGDVFNAFKYVKPEDVRVILIGQDPYHSEDKGDCTAIGLSFAARKSHKTPPSLANMYKELSNSIEGFVMPNHGDIRCWCNHGILLLNMCLTVNPGKAASHGDVWKGFVEIVLSKLRDINKNLIFLLLGKEAGTIVTTNYIEYTNDKAMEYLNWIRSHNGTDKIPADLKKIRDDYTNKCIVIKAVHPSPLSAHRGFFGSGVFKSVNNILEIREQQQIDWNVL